MEHGTPKSEIETLEHKEKKDTFIPEFKTNKQWCKESGNQITWVGENIFTVFVTETLIIQADFPK